ncbi:MAG TPA: dTDP-4-dehydrorhamnose 3,5-epimerase [Bacteroidales bacterium]|jgi:dTDP-4-dehydrorhamnose 3,5-epimerase|nr:dTDP-4-dehydrorhamnose 3,5-epimerase [Bacteroidales bacterium]
MEIISTEFPGLFIIKPKIFEDSRGYFFESYNKNKLGILSDIDFIQDNQSKSVVGTIRGLHYQLEPYAQSKLIRVLEGRILDVVVDVREKSPTYGRHFSIELSCDNKHQLFVPKGFAHGFSVLSDTATVLYKTDQYYNPESERGINFNDPYLEIDWKVNIDNAIVSSKDKVLPTFKESEKNFKY